MEDNNFKENIVKLLAVIGVVALFSTGGFLTITIARNAPDIFSNISAAVINITGRFTAVERIVVEVSDLNPKTGDTVSVTFEHRGKETEGSYAFSYECLEGVHFERSFTSSDSDILFCDTLYDLPNGENAFSFKASSSLENEAEVPVFVNFIENESNAVSVRGELVLKVAGSETSIEDSEISEVPKLNEVSGAGSPSGVTRSSELTPGERTEETILFNEESGIIPSTTSGLSDPSGRIDLEARIISVGKIDRTTNEFTATSSISLKDRGAVVFEILNVGTKESGSWTFNVVVPTFPSFIYHSTGQEPLFPGDKIEYTLGFDSIRSDNKPNEIVVNADPISSIAESDETNNIVKIELPAF